MSQIDWNHLAKLAKAAAKQAYVPYSKFQVGAAIQTRSGQIFIGCNVENASFGLTNCAERTAIFSAVAAGEHDVIAVCVYTPTQVATPPCGACRQVLNEFGADMQVKVVCDSDDTIVTTLDTLLPGAFGPKNLR